MQRDLAVSTDYGGIYIGSPKGNHGYTTQMMSVIKKAHPCYEVMEI